MAAPARSTARACRPVQELLADARHYKSQARLREAARALQQARLLLECRRQSVAWRPDAGRLGVDRPARPSDGAGRVHARDPERRLRKRSDGAGARGVRGASARRARRGGRVKPRELLLIAGGLCAVLALVLWGALRAPDNDRQTFVATTYSSGRQRRQGVLSAARAEQPRGHAHPELSARQGQRSRRALDPVTERAAADRRGSGDRLRQRRRNAGRAAGPGRGSLHARGRHRRARREERVRRQEAVLP